MVFHHGGETSRTNQRGDIYYAGFGSVAVSKTAQAHGFRFVPGTVPSREPVERTVPHPFVDIAILSLDEPFPGRLRRRLRNVNPATASRWQVMYLTSADLSRLPFDSQEYRGALEAAIGLTAGKVAEVVHAGHKARWERKITNYRLGFAGIALGRLGMNAPIVVATGELHPVFAGLTAVAAGMTATLGLVNDRHLCAQTEGLDAAWEEQGTRTATQAVDTMRQLFIPA